MKILGISCEQDAGATIVENGKMVAAVNEERFSRKKLHKGFPELSIKAVCKIANFNPKDIDLIAISTLNHVNYIGFKNPTLIQKLGEKLSTIKLIQAFLHSNVVSNLIKLIIFILQFPYRRNLIQKLRALGFNQRVYFVDHHDCHSYSAYYTSGFEDCMVITLDGAGDGFCSKVYLPGNKTLKEVHKVPFYSSPAYYYAYATNLCGFKCGREGKITGLAAFGNPEITKNIFASRINYNNKKIQFLNYGYYLNAEKEYLLKALNGSTKEEIAAGIQSLFEDLVLAYIKDLIKKYRNNKLTKLALAGGAFANVKLNQKISELKNVEEISVFPHMGDGGLATGAAYVLLSKKKLIKPYTLNNAYLGTDYTNEDYIQALENNSKSVAYSRVTNIACTIAKALQEGKVVAYFNGRMEYGPRALGNRSIFISAKDPSINQWLNEKLCRSEFMPFAPMILKEKESEYFKNLDSKHKCTKFMTITTQVTNKALTNTPAAVHIDGTARFQSITKDQNPVIHEMLESYYKLTGIPAVINTSFNMHEEPIVESPRDAVKAFLQGGLDILVLGNYIVERKESDKLEFLKEKDTITV
ncbi:MAG: hypothetical protein HYR97_06460 [Candidatus Melainabacteria bacterium]|nr:hypothetical protein [Candidatus Melainabacteria bacterium]